MMEFENINGDYRTSDKQAKFKPNENDGVSKH